MIKDNVMRRLLILLFSFFVFTSVQGESLSLGDTAPDWNLPTAADEDIEYYTDSNDQVSMVLFWATWCPYCARLMPHLQDVYQQYHDKGLRFYAIDIFEDGEIDPVNYFAQHGYTYTLLLNGDLVAEDYGVKGTPALFVVDKNKKIIYSRKSGANEEQVKLDVIQAIETSMQ